MGVFLMFNMVPLSFWSWACAAAMATFLHGLLCFVYVLCVFGPYETSVRMRLVREIFNAPPGGMPDKELFQRYNNKNIVQIRLMRLIGSKDIIEKDGFYQAGSKTNAFFLFDIIAAGLVKMIGRTPKEGRNGING
jgi:hypothetical protein